MRALQEEGERGRRGIAEADCLRDIFPAGEGVLDVPGCGLCAESLSLCGQLLGTHEVGALQAVAVIALSLPPVTPACSLGRTTWTTRRGV